MVEIKRSSRKSFDRVEIHVVFIHGLEGNIELTWTSGEGSDAEFWPKWLEEDLLNVAVWSVGYPASRFKWNGGIAMAPEDRAEHILQRLLAEPELENGTIILVGHSMGGVIIKEMLRLADTQAAADQRVASFECRVRKVVFIATPHQGSWMSSVASNLGLFFRPSAATAALGRNDRHLAALNAWFRDYAVGAGLAVRGFGETLRTCFGRVVLPDSSDMGLPSPAKFTLLDEDHSSISKPTTRAADIYVFLKDFVRESICSDHPRVVQARQLQSASDGVQEFLRRDGGEPIRGVINPIIDRSAAERVWRMRRSRYFVGVDPQADARQISRDVLEGELLNASNATKSDALAWCARFLSSDDPTEAERLVEEARRLGTGDEIRIASAFITAARGDKQSAQASISSIRTPLGQTATLMIGLNGLSSSEAVEWINGNGPAFEDLDGDGKFIAMVRLIVECEVDQAIDAASRVTLTDTDYCPTLHYFVGMSHLLAAVPPEMQKVLVEHTPFDWAQFPLQEDPASLGHLRSARESFTAAALAAARLGCDTARQNADDFALWLALRDPAAVVAAREQLVRSMADPRDMVHRVPMAIQFGLQLDRAAVERAITSVEAMGGADGSDALLARFVLALEDNDPATLAQFIGTNRDRLSLLVGTTEVSSFEIRALAESDRAPEAQAKLTELRLSGTATEEELQRLDGALAEVRGEDTISAIEERFRTSAALDDLIVLVRRLQDREDWVRLAPYARQLFDRLNSLQSASAYVRAAHEGKDLLGVVTFLKDKTDFLDRSDNLREIYAWSLFRLGYVVRSRDALAPLLAKRNNPNDQALQINVAITCGDWGSLATLVENVWNDRADRSATDLLQAGQIGAIIGSSRAKGLFHEAVVKSPTDATVLVSAYLAAVSGGWEDNEEVSGWLRTAMEASDGQEGTPLQRRSLNDLMDMRPDWEHFERETWDQLFKGQTPLFVVAMRLNRTTISMLLTPALANLDEADPRKCVLVPTFSGRAAASIAPTPVAGSIIPQAARRRSADNTTIALEASSLLVLSFLDRLGLVIEQFRQTVIPHSTLRWLIGERQRTEFHQPSQVRRARELRDLLSQDAYFIVDAIGRPDLDLTYDVGEELAILLETARTFDEEAVQRVVVRPGPVHRPASLMKEDADLSEFGDVLCGCGDVVTALLAQGQLTDEEAAKAKDYLDLHEVRWEQAPAIRTGATLLLDDLAISTLQHLRLIGKLGIAGFRVGIPRGHAERVDALIRYEFYANETIEHIERIRSALADGIASGKVRLGQEAADEDEKFARVAQYPTAGVFGLAPLVDLVIVDDRALNQFPNVHADGNVISVGCTLDLLEILERSAAISVSERTEAETKLRRAGFQMMPLRLDELVRLVNAAPIQNGKIQETAHLKSIRESIERLRMTDTLQLPADQQWFDSLLMTVRESLRAQWNDEIDDATARARSDWLLGLLHIQGWSHRFDAANDRDAIINRYRSISWLIMSAPLTSIGESMRRYSAWMESTLIEQMRSFDPASLDALVEQVRNYIEAFAEQLDQRRDDDNRGA